MRFVPTCFWKVNTFDCQLQRSPEIKHWSPQGGGLVVTRQESWLTQHGSDSGVRGGWGRYHTRKVTWEDFQNNVFLWFCHFRLIRDWWIECIWRRFAATLKLCVLIWASGGRGLLTLFFRVNMSKKKFALNFDQCSEWPKYENKLFCCFHIISMKEFMEKAIFRVISKPVAVVKDLRMLVVMFLVHFPSSLSSEAVYMQPRDQPVAQLTH